VYETRTVPLRWAIHINGDGHRGPALPGTTSGAFPVIAAFGDSCTFGFRVGEGETYPSQLQGLLRQGTNRAAVANFGVPGYTSFQGLRQLRRVLAVRRPNYIVLAYGANDIESDLLSDADKAAMLSSWSFRTRNALSWFAFGRLFIGRSDRYRTTPGDVPQTVRVSESDFRANVRAMVTLARASGIRVILLHLSLVAPLRRDALVEIAREHNVPFVDARDVLESGLDDLLTGRRFQSERAEIERFWQDDVVRYRTVYYDKQFYETLFNDPVRSALLHYLLVDPVHPNGLGHRLVAEALAGVIASGAR